MSDDAGLHLRGGFGEHRDMIGRIAWSPDGRWLATPSNDHTVGIWDVAKGILKQLLTAMARGYSSLPGAGPAPMLSPGFYAATFSPDGRLLATASGDGLVRLWDSNRGSVLARLEGHRGKVLSIAFSPQGDLLASGSEDRTARLWSVARGELVRELVMPSTGDEVAFVFSITFSPDGRRIATGTFDGRARIWDSSSGELQQTLGDHRSAVYSVSWSPGGEGLAAASNDGTVSVWNAETGEQAAVLEGHTKAVFCVACSPDSRFLASKSMDDTVRLWRCDTWQCIAEVDEPGSGWWASGLAFHPRALRLATLADRDRRVRIWELNPAELLSTQVRSAAHQRAESVVLAHALNQAAHEQRQAGQVVNALGLYEMALKTRLTIPDFLNASTNCRNIAQVYLMLGRLPEAAEAARQSLVYVERIMDSDPSFLEEMAGTDSGDLFDRERWDLGFSHAFLATAEAMMGNDDRAREAFAAAAQAQRRPHPISIHACWYAMWLSRRGLTDRAREALSLSAPSSDDPARLHETCLFHIARAWVERHALARGEAGAQSAEQIASVAEAAVEVGRRSGAHWYLATALLEAGLCSDRGQVATAHRLLDEAQRMAQAADYRLILAELLVAQAHLAAREGEIETGRSFGQQAVELCRRKDCGYAWARQDAEALLATL